MRSPPVTPPPPYDEQCEACGHRPARRRDKQQPEGPPWQFWVVVTLVCVICTYGLARVAYKPLPEHNQTPPVQQRAVLPYGAAELVAVGARGLNTSEKFSLNPFKSFKAGNSGVKAGLIVGGLTLFNTGVSNCEQRLYISCVTGILSGLLVTAAGLWAPVPGRRSAVPFENLTISIDQFDPTSTHPAHLFIRNYRDVLERNPSFGTAPIGYVHYTNVGARRHRLVVEPGSRSTGLAKRQDEDGYDDDGGSVSYEWTDFGASSKGVDTNKADYDILAGDVANYLEENKSNNICLTQCIGQRPYEVGQLQTQAGKNPHYDTVCEFSDDMVSCT